MKVQTIKKADLADMLFHKGNKELFSRSESKSAIEHILKQFFESAANGEMIYFTNLGKIKSRFKEGGRPVRNPKTGEPFVMGPTISIRFFPAGSVSVIGSNRTKLTKQKIIDSMEIETGFVHKARAVYQVFIDALELVLKEGKRIELRGFGIFSRKKTNDRIGRNPKTGESVHVTGGYAITFKASRILQQEANRRLIDESRENGSNE